MALVLILATAGNGAHAGVKSGGHATGLSWSENIDNLYIAGSGDNPWALPQTKKEKPQGPAYQVNPHYVTPEDIESDSLPQPDRTRKRKPSSTTSTSGSSSWRSQQGYPVAPNFAPGYTLPGYGGYYGGYYGGLPGMDVGAPGFGGNPMLYPYPGGSGIDMSDPYNLMMQPYSIGGEEEGD